MGVVDELELEEVAELVYEVGDDLAADAVGAVEGAVFGLVEAEVGDAVSVV